MTNDKGKIFGHETRDMRQDMGGTKQHATQHEIRQGRKEGVRETPKTRTRDARDPDSDKRLCKKEKTKDKRQKTTDNRQQTKDKDKRLRLRLRLRLR